MARWVAGLVVLIGERDYTTTSAKGRAAELHPMWRSSYAAANPAQRRISAAPGVQFSEATPRILRYSTGLTPSSCLKALEKAGRDLYPAWAAIMEIFSSLVRSR